MAIILPIWTGARDLPRLGDKRLLLGQGGGPRVVYACTRDLDRWRERETGAQVLSHVDRRLLAPGSALT